MKILYDHQAFTIQKYGGVSRYFYEIANHIAGMEGQEVEIFAPLYINEYFRNDCKVRPRGIKIPHLPRTGRIVTAVNLTALRLPIKPRRSVDIFHETYYSMANCCPRSAKRVLTVYDMIHEKFADNFLRRDKTQQIKAHAVRRADHVICISENTRQDLIALLGVQEEKTSVVYLGSSLVTQKVAAKPAEGKKPFILYVGFRGGYKNFEGLLRAYGRSPLLKNGFSIVCFGGGGFSASELSLAESLHISQGNILYMSGTDDILAGLYTSAAAFVFPSLYEGFGIPPLEAMSFGCPVVSANVSSLPEVVGDAAELFDPTDEAEMRAAIERVISTPERAQLLVDRGYERAKQFSWEKCARDTLNIYIKLLRG
jgi:glycosyltransferase involved in cell wall biosynthesis